jgi:heme exporter protein A
MILSLALDDLACIRGERTLFRGLRYSVKAGETLSLEGPNGVGKTSLLRMIAGFLAPAAGIIRLRTSAGDITEAELRGKLAGWFGHQDGVKPQLRVREQLAFYARLYGDGDAGETMERFGLAPLAALPGQYLSAGQKRRLALARLTLMGRPLWLLDEPLAALDRAGRALVARTVAAHCAEGGIAIAATHEPLGVDCETLNLERLA